MISIDKEELSNEGVKFTMKDNNVVDTDKYIDFVSKTTSAPSTDYVALLGRMSELESQDANVPKLMTAAFGLTAEAGEFAEVVKKIFLQGKPYNEENVFHMKRELGDIMWYIAQACMALDADINEILKLNYEKLSARYPEGTFDVWRSENRKEGDI